MANFPGSLDSNAVLTDGPTGSEIVSGDHNSHSEQIEAIEAKVGADGSAVTTSHDYRLSSLKNGDKVASYNLPRGAMINGRIAVSVASSNITVAIKGIDGNNPSATNPVYVRIGDNIRVLTAALSVTKNAGTNWFTSGSTGFATKEADYFVYLGYNATDGVVIGFARIPYATQYSDFSATTTAYNYAAISTITTAASTDFYEVVGRFGATLSGTASFNWSVPTFSSINLIQRPIYTTRLLSFVPIWTNLTVGNGTSEGIYEQNMRRVFIRGGVEFGSSSSMGSDPSLNFPIPAVDYRAVLTNNVVRLADAILRDDNSTVQYRGTLGFNGSTLRLLAQDSSGATVNNILVTATVPFTWTTSDAVYFQGDYQGI